MADIGDSDYISFADKAHGFQSKQLGIAWSNTYTKQLAFCHSRFTSLIVRKCKYTILSNTARYPYHPKQPFSKPVVNDEMAGSSTRLMLYLDSSMQMESLRYFVELARAGSFYGAAKNMFISQQGLNKAVRALEAELDCQLIVRKRRGIELTKDGETFLVHAQAILAEYNALLDDLVIHPEQSQPQRPRLTINVSYYGAQVLYSLLHVLDILSTCTIVEKPFRQIMEEAAQSDGTQLYLVDLYADTYSEIKAAGTLGFDAVAATQFGIVWQEGSPLAGKSPLHRADLAGFPLAVDSHREMLRYAEYVYEDYPLSNIQFGVANPRATLSYALTSPQVASTFDSFGFAVACRTSILDMEALNFTPLATPRAKGWLGFVFNPSNKPRLHGRRFIDLLKAGLIETFPEHYERYPL